MRTSADAIKYLPGKLRITHRSRSLSVDFDAKRGPSLFEVKTGYEWVLNENPTDTWRISKQLVIARFTEQAISQMEIADECDYQLYWYFNNERVAKFFLY